MKRSMETPDRFWDRRAAKYDERAQEDEEYVRAAERFGEYLEPDHTVLDYACGTGVVAFEIAADVKHVHAIDTSGGMIERAKERARERAVANVRFEQKGIFDDSLAEASYDAVLAFNILHLLRDAREAVDRFAELLPAGGLLVSSTPCLAEAGLIARTFLPLISKVGILSYLRSFSVDDVETLTRDAGFQILEADVLEDKIPSCFLIARKP